MPLFCSPQAADIKRPERNELDRSTGTGPVLALQEPLAPQRHTTSVEVRERLVSRDRDVAMIYLFSKRQQFVQCEIQPGSPHLFTVVDSSGEELTERYHSTTELQERWSEVTSQLSREGWSGPHIVD